MEHNGWRSLAIFDCGPRRRQDHRGPAIESRREHRGQPPGKTDECFVTSTSSARPWRYALRTPVPKHQCDDALRGRSAGGGVPRTAFNRSLYSSRRKCHEPFLEDAHGSALREVVEGAVHALSGPDHMCTICHQSCMPMMRWHSRHWWSCSLQVVTPKAGHGATIWCARSTATRHHHPESALPQPGRRSRQQVIEGSCTSDTSEFKPSIRTDAGSTFYYPSRQHRRALGPCSSTEPNHKHRFWFLNRRHRLGKTTLQLRHLGAPVGRPGRGRPPSATHTSISIRCTVGAALGIAPVDDSDARSTRR